jgi:hypothetical protein
MTPDGPPKSKEPRFVRPLRPSQLRFEWQCLGTPRARLGVTGVRGNGCVYSTWPAQAKVWASGPPLEIGEGVESNGRLLLLSHESVTRSSNDGRRLSLGRFRSGPPSEGAVLLTSGDEFLSDHENDPLA